VTSPTRFEPAKLEAKTNSKFPSIQGNSTPRTDTNVRREPNKTYALSFLILKGTLYLSVTVNNRRKLVEPMISPGPHSVLIDQIPVTDLSTDFDLF
jgi:hypothetical protein